MNYREWYQDPQVKAKLIEFSFNRSICVGEPKYLKLGQKLSREFRVHYSKELDHFYSYTNLLDHKRNVFNSLVEYKNGFSYFNKEFECCPLFIDIDAKFHDWMDLALDSLKLVVSFLDRYECPFYVRFSGCGFHVVIPAESFSFREDPCRNYAKILKELLKETAMIDMLPNSLHAKIKTPFSLAIYKDVEYVCCPMDREAIRKFNIKNYLPQSYLVKKENYLFNGGLSADKLERKCLR